MNALFDPLVQRWREKRRLDGLLTDWERLRISHAKVVVQHPPKRLLLIPSDPRTFSGSRGDEAMIRSVLNRLKPHYEDFSAATFVKSAEGEAAAKALGFQTLNGWEPFSLETVLREAERFQPDCVVVMGADVMDGHYSALTTARLLLVADLLVRRGITGVVLGFSFNERPARSLRKVFKFLHPSLHLNIRDSRSLKRFRAFSKTAAELVADVAFTLEARQEDLGAEKLRLWIDSRHACGQRIIVFNIHPMLVPSGQRAEALVKAATKAIEQVSAKRLVSWLFLPHDFRGGQLGDDACLGPVAAALESRLGERQFYIRDSISAAGIKAVAGAVDGICTGRMHLAIAALGMGCPVVALTYQDKFAGLFDHFGLGEELLLNPEKIETGLESLLLKLIDRADEIKSKVQSHLPEVMRAAERNLQPLVGTSYARASVAAA